MATKKKKKGSVGTTVTTTDPKTGKKTTVWTKAKKGRRKTGREGPTVSKYVIDGKKYADKRAYKEALTKKKEVKKTVIPAKEKTLVDIGEPMIREPVAPVGAAVDVKAPETLGGAIKQDIEDIMAGKNLPNLQDVTMALGAGGVAKGVTSAAGKLSFLTNKAWRSTSAANIKSNGVTQKLTGTFLGKISKSTAAAGAILGAIGSYPFAGFIKEEALQTLGFATEGAFKNKDAEGMRAALDAQAEILDPDTWAQLFAVIPYANVLSSLKKFYEAAATKLEVDERRFEKLKGELEAGQTERQRTMEEEKEFFRVAAEERRAQVLKERAEDTAFFESLKKND